MLYYNSPRYRPLWVPNGPAAQFPSQAKRFPGPSSLELMCKLLCRSSWNQCTLQIMYPKFSIFPSIQHIYVINLASPACHSQSDAFAQNPMLQNLPCTSTHYTVKRIEKATAIVAFSTYYC